MGRFNGGEEYGEACPEALRPPPYSESGVSLHELIALRTQPFFLWL